MQNTSNINRNPQGQEKALSSGRNPSWKRHQLCTTASEDRQLFPKVIF